MSDLYARYERYLERHQEYNEEHFIDEESEEYEEPLSFDDWIDEYHNFNRYEN